ncbi:MAG: thioesterase family protein [Ilumatobacteraceae bacterium]|nr:thioesterase family protein [Ilumatobacteraceae bacterium]
MSTEFEAATAVRRRADGGYDARIAPGWDIGGNANGGYVIALAARAMSDAVGRPPLSLTAHYLAPGRPGPVVIDVDVIRSGRRTATVAARVRAGETEVLALLGTFAEQEPGGPSVIVGEPPDLPPVEECVSASPPVDSGFHDRIVSSVRPIDAGFRDGRPSGTAEAHGWFALPDTDRIDVFALLMATDAFAPVVFNRAEFPLGWSPTLELTVHVRGVPAPGALRGRFSSRFMADGMFDESGELWDSAGRLVAHSRQLALVPRG